jgi:hypothetical protein
MTKVDESYPPLAPPSLLWRMVEANECVVELYGVQWGGIIGNCLLGKKWRELMSICTTVLLCRELSCLCETKIRLFILAQTWRYSGSAGRWGRERSQLLRLGPVTVEGAR